MELTGQIVFDVIILIGGFLAAWAYTRIYTLLDRIESEMKQIPEKYVAKDDYREDIREIKDLLGAIFKRLDNKADK
tara:strand:+ start:283 stop:510 length:228 start_codon:yes stop_codon:yes gene_type:complete